MKKQYYLIAQLPDISFLGENQVLPITEKYYRDLCARFLEKDKLHILENLFLEAPKSLESTGSQFLDRWYENERYLRYALAQIRAQKLKKDVGNIPVLCPADIMQTAKTAVGMDSPLSAEQFLYEYRLKVLDELKPIDLFSEDAVFAYGIRLMLIQRMKQFDKARGADSYHKIYDSILGVKI